MTEEERQLLLRDICGRLPYGLKVCHINLSDEMPKVWDLIGMPALHLADILIEGTYRFAAVNIKENIRPYLRPMSSMTEDEKAEYNLAADKDLDRMADKVGRKLQGDEKLDETLTPYYEHIDWLNKKMFDYRGLIERGLALEAPKNMYIL